MLRVGDKLGAYEVVSDFKSGGMATLYLARRVGAAGFARLVAMKVIHPHLTKDEAFVRMFVDEALLSVRIEHPNVVRVEELGEHDKVPFLVMEYVHGCSLAQLLTELARRGESMLAEVATHVAIQVADGLHAAHETRGLDGEQLGVVHRDVSPQNVLLGTNGAVKVIDFGIAKARGRGLHTTTGTVKGKFRYMSPEQSRGEPVDRRTDVFALGIVLWEMLTSQRLFDAPHDAMVIDQVRKPKVTPPSKLVPGIPAALDRVVLQALSADRERRPASAHELRQLLAAAVPKALSVSGAEVSALVGSVMADEMRRQTESLPESVRVMLKGVTPIAAGTPRGGDHPLALPPDAATPGSAREQAETLVDTGDSVRRRASGPNAGVEAGALPASLRPDAGAIPPAVLTPSVVTGESSVEHRRPRRRAPALAAIGALGLASAIGALVAVRPWETRSLDALDDPPSVTRSLTTGGAGPPPSGSVHDDNLGLTGPRHPLQPAPPAPPAPSSADDDDAGATLTSRGRERDAGPDSTAAGDSTAGSASPPGERPGTRGERRRATRPIVPREPRAPRTQRAGGLVDGVPIADEGGFGP
ncbi:MAG: serine/threonine protein kinase [Deltaproteobacteria bacterium]|nr:serine/threonine protein kinase [Deltaproteobacteria bacterium]